MFKKSAFCMSIIIILSMTNCNNSHITSTPASVCIDNNEVFKLADFYNYSASVTLTFTENNTLWAILPREAEGGKHPLGKWHKYDDCSGSREKEETHAEQTAAHELWEEGMMKQTLGWSLEQTEEFIKPENKNTWAVIIYSKDKNPCDPQSRTIRNVTYFTHFDEYKDTFFDEFYNARKKELQRYKKEGVYQKHLRTTVEKDMIAKVEWNKLQAAIRAQKDPNEIVYVEAYILHPKTKKFRKKSIALRPFFPIKTRPFFAGNSYIQGEHEKIRYYRD